MGTIHNRQGRQCTNVKVVRSIAPSLDKEAIRVVKSIPKWNPAKQRGKPVRVIFQVPIKFVLGE
jgi:protein TonB